MKYYMYKFLNTNLFKGKYIVVNLKFYTNENNLISIGENFNLNINDNSDIKKFRHFIEHNFKLFLNERAEVNVVKVIFNYRKLSKKEYLENKS